MNENKQHAEWGAWKTEFDTSDLLGEVVAWDTPNTGHGGMKIPYAQVIKALEDASLDTKLARTIAPPKALRRAVRELRRTKIVGEVEDTNDRLVFQFSRAIKQATPKGTLPWATLDGEVLSYEGEGRVVLDKNTGDLDGDNPELKQVVGQLLDYAIGHRGTSDITGIAHLVFKSHADLFPIRRMGGCYFVPACHAGVVDAVAKFLAGVGAALRRYPVAKGKLTGDSSVRDAVRDGLSVMIQDHLDQIQKFSTATRDSTMSKELESIKLTRFKIEAYSDYLEHEAAQLRVKIEEADRVWQNAVEAVLEMRDETNNATTGAESLAGVA